MSAFDSSLPNTKIHPQVLSKTEEQLESAPIPSQFESDELGKRTTIRGPALPPPPEGSSPPDEYLLPQYKSNWISAFVTWTLLFALALLLFGIGTQVLYYYSIVSALPLVPKWIFIIGGCVCLTVIFTVFGKICFFWYKLKTNNISHLLSERRKWQNCAAKNAEHDKSLKARELLEQYLKEFCLEDENQSDSALLKSLGMSKEDVDAMSKAKNGLLSIKGMTSTDWIMQFQSDFQSKLDTLAKARVSAYYYKVLYGTAVSPRALVDQIIVTLATTTLVSELLQIYRLKPTPGQTLFLVVHAFLNIYASGEVQDKVENAVDNLGNAVESGYQRIQEDLLQATGPKVIEGLPFIGKTLQFFGGKFAEGAINALLLRNLARKIIQWIQPTIPKGEIW